MELKVFGPDGPPEEFASDLKTLLGLDALAWDAIERWFLNSDSLDPDEAIVFPAIEASSLRPEQLRQSLLCIQFLLESWYFSGLELRDLQRDLLVLGVPAREIDRLGVLLEKLAPLRRRVYRQLMRHHHETAVLPTLEDISVVCDVRPVFEDYVFPRRKGNVNCARLLGFSNMVLMELSAEDDRGNSHTLSFQMTEATLGELRAAIQRASEQLDILKAKTSVLSTES